MTKLLKNKGSYFFLGGVLLVYLLLIVLDSQNAYSALLASFKIMLNILPVLLLVVFFTAIIKFYLTPKDISRYVGRDSGIRGWIFATIGGILSHGPAYVWYTMLGELREQGMSNGLIGVFLYARSIKLPLLPVMIALFGATFVGTLYIFMLAGSVVQGLILKKLFD